MSKKSNRKILYGNANYLEIVYKNGYFVDKTIYIEKLETVENPVFLRPRRFGKSLWCNILECYYDINKKNDFKTLFGHTYIGQNPTKLKNSFFVLHLDFSVIELNNSIHSIENNFKRACNIRLDTLIELYKKWFQGQIEINFEESASSNLDFILQFIKKKNLPQLYVIIDEYDNFANQLIISNKTQLYEELTDDDSFLKSFFKILKQGRKDGTISNVFITGVLPITLYDLASGFNIAQYLTLDPNFESMLGFTQKEVIKLLDDIYIDYKIDSTNRKEVEDVIKSQYNGYHFVNSDGDALYNSTLLMYFLKWFIEQNTIPIHLTDLNLKTDISWIRILTGSKPKHTQKFLKQLLINENISYDDRLLTTKFTISQFFKENFFPVSFFYLGMLTREDEFSLRIPNINMYQIFVEYFNEVQNIDVSTHYREMMKNFINKPVIPRLFSEYWEKYISQLPEAVFAQVNENFYRATFFELCSRYLSKWFIWDMERSYPKGRPI